MIKLWNWRRLNESIMMRFWRGNNNSVRKKRKKKKKKEGKMERVLVDD